MRRCGIEIVIQLFNVLPVVPLRVPQTEETLLQNGVVAVPQRCRKAKPTLSVCPTENAIFPPSVCTIPRHVMGKVPSVSVGRIVLSYCPPLSLWKIRPPSLPILLAASGPDESLLFRPRGHIILDFLTCRCRVVTHETSLVLPKRNADKTHRSSTFFHSSDICYVHSRLCERKGRFQGNSTGTANYSWPLWLSARVPIDVLMTRSRILRRSRHRADC